MAVTLGKSTLVEKLEELAAIDEKIATARGDEKVIRAQAHHDLLIDGDVQFGGEDQDHEMYGRCYNEVVELVNVYRTLVYEAEAWLEQQVNERVKMARDASKDDVTALLEARATTAGMAEALRTILEGAGIADLPEVPRARKPNGTAGQSTRTVKVSGARYYRIVKGETSDQPDSQNTLSSLVYYQSHHVTGTRMTTEDFVTFGKEKGVDVKSATPWELTLSDDVTVGMRVVPAN